MRGFVQALWNWKNLEKHLYFCPFWMPTTWGEFWAACTKTKIFFQNALTKPRFRRDRWRGIAPPHVPWHFSYSFIWYILPHPSRKALRHDHFMRATTTGLQCQFATGKATTAGQDNDTSRKSWAEAQGWDSHGPDSLSGIRWIQRARGRGQIGAQKINFERKIKWKTKTEFTSSVLTTAMATSKQPTPASLPV